MHTCIYTSIHTYIIYIIDLPTQKILFFYLTKLISQEDSTDFDSSEDEDGDDDGGEDEPSSGYQTSQALSPLSSPVESATHLACPRIRLVVHCTDEVRQGLLIVPLSANLALNSGKSLDKQVASMDVYEARYYLGGKLYQVRNI